MIDKDRNRDEVFRECQHRVSYSNIYRLFDQMDEIEAVQAEKNPGETEAQISKLKVRNESLQRQVSELETQHQRAQELLAQVRQKRGQ